MNAFQPNAADTGFILLDVLRAPETLAALPALADNADPDLIRQVAEEAGKFVGEVVAPLNRDGDEIGAQWKAGAVTMPPGFRDAYQAFWQAGWPALSSAPEDGGQGLPAALEAMLYEWLSAANHGWTMAPGLLHGAYECIKHHASDALKAHFLAKVATGEWLATMCLTEPHAGSDLGLCRTKAVPLANDPEGRYALSGTKIFISGGEHDLTDNIVHLVLARLPDAPPGPKGLSLFLVPKFYADGTRSAVVCERIEEKMGLHGSPTCVMRFDEAAAWIVGEPGKGLNAMFVMMNAARLHVGLQGVGLLEAAWQKADAYSKERRQMRAPGGAAKATPVGGPPPDGQAPSGGNALHAVKSMGASFQADLIEQHPAMRRILDAQRAWIDAGRVIAYRTALELDVIKHHSDPARQARANRWCTLVTPVLKAAWTDQAFHGASACLQVFGGHGFVREWGIEQIVRDSRVAMIYEGTNEIQAIDLLLRKTLPDGGGALQALLKDLSAELPDGDAGSARVRSEIDRFAHFVREQLVPATQADGAAADLPHWLADDFLRATAMLLMAWGWARIAATPGADTPRWQTAYQGFWRWVWPEFDMRLAMMAQTLST
ncbi:acyl-CoA dehydrogenase family protein [Hydrogenophaga electricum]|uniref:Acyl-CoA dehydrogenase n=1 Tax=Hydrogenophaga electricum TaxID=1230953 RepID=A0ABQ6C072_9BURK|nr:acyl-CoA dehydrogenase family protein [Hydrogenophaga electricum]GLS13766.1 acyl-CoA dehydrogenase [Hydrogenophaga electricum]